MIIRIGALGLDGAEDLLTALHTTPGARVVGLALNGPQDALPDLGKLPVVRAYPNLRELQARARVDAVVVAGPTAGRSGAVRQALEAGLHVLWQPPIGSRAEVSRLMAVAERAERVLMVSYPLWYQMRSAVTESLHDLGEPTLVDAWWFMEDGVPTNLDPRDPRGVAASLGAELLAAALPRIDAEPFSVTAVASCTRPKPNRHGPLPAEDTIEAVVQFPGERHVRIFASWHAPGLTPLLGLSLVGTTGVSARVPLPIELSAGSEASTDAIPLRLLGPPTSRQAATRGVAADFVAAIATGVRMGVPSALAIDVAWLVEVIYAAARSGGPVDPRSHPTDAYGRQ